MTFPTVQDADTQSGTVATNATSWTITYPTNIAAGDLLLLFVAMDGTVNATAAGFTDVGGNSAAAISLRALAKVADGTETGTFTATITSTEQGAWRIFRVTGWFGGTINAASSGDSDSNGIAGRQTSGITANPDPVVLDPANWAAEDVVWFAAAAADTSRTFSAFPTNYTNTSSDVSGGASGASLGVARRALNASSEDPGTFTISASDDWSAVTVAVRPAAAAASQVPYSSPYPQLLPQ